MVLVEQSLFSLCFHFSSESLVSLCLALRYLLHQILLCTSLNTMSMERCRKESSVFYLQSWKLTYLKSTVNSYTFSVCLFLWQSLRCKRSKGWKLKSEQLKHKPQSGTSVKLQRMLCGNGLIQGLQHLPCFLSRFWVSFPCCLRNKEVMDTCKKWLQEASVSFRISHQYLWWGNLSLIRYGIQKTHIWVGKLHVGCVWCSVVSLHSENLNQSSK